MAKQEAFFFGLDVGKGELNGPREMWGLVKNRVVGIAIYPTGQLACLVHHRRGYLSSSSRRNRGDGSKAGRTSPTKKGTPATFIAKQGKNRKPNIRMFVTSSGKMTPREEANKSSGSDVSGPAGEIRAARAMVLSLGREYVDCRSRKDERLALRGD